MIEILRPEFHNKHLASSSGEWEMLASFHMVFHSDLQSSHQRESGCLFQETRVDLQSLLTQRPGKVWICNYHPVLTILTKTYLQGIASLVHLSALSNFRVVQMIIKLTLIWYNTLKSNNLWWAQQTYRIRSSSSSRWFAPRKNLKS